MSEENLPEELVIGLNKLVKDHGLINFEAALIGTGIGIFALKAPAGKVLRDGDQYEFTPENGWNEPVINNRTATVTWTATGGQRNPKRKLKITHADGTNQEHEFEANKSVNLVHGRVFVFPK